jgi:hypothetical protein
MYASGSDLLLKVNLEIKGLTCIAPDLVNHNHSQADFTATVTFTSCMAIDKNAKQKELDATFDSCNLETLQRQFPNKKFFSMKQFSQKKT